MGILSNYEEPDEMQHDAGSALFANIKTIFRDRKNHNLDNCT